jgi:hypothetical protein
MNSKYTYKNKLYLLVIGAVLFLILSFRLAFTRTISEKKVLNENKVQFSYIEEAPAQLQLLESQLKEYDKQSSFSVYNPEEFQVRLLERVTMLSHGADIKLVEIPKIHLENRDDLIIKTQQLVFQGSFNNLLKFLEKTGRDINVGNICSVDFYNQKDNNSGSTHLKMRVYFQLLTENKKK